MDISNFDTYISIDFEHRGAESHLMILCNDSHNSCQLFCKADMDSGTDTSLREYDWMNRRAIVLGLKVPDVRLVQRAIIVIS